MKVLIPNKISNDRYSNVLNKMKKLGPPIVEVFEISNGLYFALEGSHRISAAKELGIEPVLNIVAKVNDVEEFQYVYELSRQRERKGLMVEF
jgi:uncharacterized ParB-like nuclease family protein